MKLYTDGGVIVRNPSIYGGTYAYILVKGSKVIHKQSGVFVPSDMKGLIVTNNQTELAAVLLGLQYAQEQELSVNEVVSDSKVTLIRVFRKWSHTNVPQWMTDIKESLSLTGIYGTFVKGHNGDKFNEMADKMCDTEHRNFLVKQRLTAYLPLLTR